MPSSYPDNNLVDWTVPQNIVPGQYYIYVSEQDINNSSIREEDKSDAPFSIVGAGTPSITVLSPNGGEKIYGGDPYTASPYVITWKSANIIGMLDILLMKGEKIIGNYIGQVGIFGSPNTFTSSIWRVKDEPTGSLLPEGNDYKVRIRLNNNFNIFDDSDAPFSIWTSKSIPAITSFFPASAYSGTNEKIKVYGTDFNKITNIRFYNGSSYEVEWSPISDGMVEILTPKNLPIG